MNLARCLPVVYVTIIVTIAQGQPGTVNPWRAQSDSLPPPEHRIEVLVRASAKNMSAYEPLLVNVTLSNRDILPLTIDVRDDGLPHRAASLVTQPDGIVVRMHQWLTHSETSPARHEVVLAPGESTTGELLILRGGYPTGVAFPEPGIYTVQCACQPDGRFAPVLSNEAKVFVEPISDTDRAFFTELRALSISYLGVNMDYLIETEGETIREYEFGFDLLKRVIRQTKPLRIDPEGDAYNRKQAALVETLTDLLKRFPDTAYAGYLARYVGLVHIETFERVASHGQLERWTQENLTEELQAVYDRAAKARETALRYLTTAAGQDLWPRTAAYFQLGRLYGLSEQWDKVHGCAVKIRRIDVSNASELADRLESDVNGYRAKLERSKSAKQERERDR